MYLFNWTKAKYISFHLSFSAIISYLSMSNPKFPRHKFSDMSHHSSYLTHYLAKKEMDAWWNMLNCIFNFLTASTHYALQASITEPTQSLNKKESLTETNLEDFPFFLELFKENLQTLTAVVNGVSRATETDYIEPVYPNVIIDVKYSEAFEKCCESMHKLQDSIIEEYERRQAEIFELFSEQNQLLRVQMPHNHAIEIETESMLELEQAAMNYANSFDESNSNCDKEVYIEAPNITSDYECNVFESDSEESGRFTNHQTFPTPINETLVYTAEIEPKYPITLCERDIQEVVANDNFLEMCTKKVYAKYEEVPSEIPIPQLNEQRSRTPATESRYSRIPQRLPNLQKNKKNAKLEAEINENKEIQDSTKYSKNQEMDKQEEIRVGKPKKRCPTAGCSISHVSRSAKGTNEYGSQTIDKNGDKRNCSLKRTSFLGKRYASVESVVKKLITPNKNTSITVDDSSPNGKVKKMFAQKEINRHFSKTTTNTSSAKCQTIDNGNNKTALNRTETSYRYSR